VRDPHWDSGWKSSGFDPGVGVIIQNSVTKIADDRRSGVEERSVDVVWQINARSQNALQFPFGPLFFLAPPRGTPTLGGLVSVGPPRGTDRSLIAGSVDSHVAVGPKLMLGGRLPYRSWVNEFPQRLLV